MSDPEAPENEFILYPNPKKVTGLPREEIRPFILDHLSSDALPDYERSIGLGQLARRLHVENMETALEQWVQDHASAPHTLDAAALFLTGYWTRRKHRSPLLIRALLHSVETAPDELGGARDTAVIALQIAHDRVAEQPLGSEIRAAFTKLWPRREQFQEPVRRAIEEVLAEDPSRIPRDAG
jgi:hypothetical protein